MYLKLVYQKKKKRIYILSLKLQLKKKNQNSENKYQGNSLAELHVIWVQIHQKYCLSLSEKTHIIVLKKIQL